MQPLEPGEGISNRFRLTARLGAGGMGEVWSAWDRELQEQVALKFINPELSARPDVLELLRQECRNSRRLIHPNIVRVYDFHRSGQRAFISMELIEGESLASITGAPYFWFIGKLLSIFDALTYAHGLGIIHRDVKASNIILDLHETPRLVDFGIAALLDQGWTESGPGMVGSPHAMSPQQRAGEPPRPADDIYACGALLFQSLARRPPLASQALPPDPGRPEGLDRIVMQMLAHDPNDRPASMAELRATLEPYATPDINLTIPPPSPERQSPPVAVRAGIGAEPGQAPESLTPPAPRRTHLPARIIVPVFVLLLAAAIGVFLLLPKYVDEHLSEVAERGVHETSPGYAERLAPDHEQPKPATEAPARRAPSGADEQAARNALGIYLQIQARLEEKLVSRWAPKEHADAKASAADGDQALRKESYAEAEAFYREATGALQKLAARTDDVLAESLVRGEQALTSGKGHVARQAFEVALAIDPENQEAVKGMARARTIDDVFALIASGETHEAVGRLAFAHADFAAAREMDTQSLRASEGLQRVRRRMIEERFQETMAEAFSALERREHTRALEAFRAAEAIRPNSHAVADGIAQASEGIRLSRLETLRKKATRLESKERWAEAAAQYQTALAIEPSLVFAQEGNARALERASIMAKLEYYVDNPDLLKSQRVRETALSFLGKAGAIEPKGPELRRRVSALREQVLLATRPLSLELRSDGATEVVVYRLGSLGQFTSRNISLRPGTYTIVGSRPGYKDVRREVTLAAGKPVPPIYVACEEPI